MMHLQSALLTEDVDCLKIKRTVSSVSSAHRSNISFPHDIVRNHAPIHQLTEQESVSPSSSVSLVLPREHRSLFVQYSTRYCAVQIRRNKVISNLSSFKHTPEESTVPASVRPTRKARMCALSAAIHPVSLRWSPKPVEKRKDPGLLRAVSNWRFRLGQQSRQQISYIEIESSLLRKYSKQHHMTATGGLPGTALGVARQVRASVKERGAHFAIASSYKL